MHDFTSTGQILRLFYPNHPLFVLPVLSIFCWLALPVLQIDRFDIHINVGKVHYVSQSCTHKMWTNSTEGGKGRSLLFLNFVARSDIFVYFACLPNDVCYGPVILHDLFWGGGFLIYGEPLTHTLTTFRPSFRPHFRFYLPTPVSYVYISVRTCAPPPVRSIVCAFLTSVWQG